MNFTRSGLVVGSLLALSACNSGPAPDEVVEQFHALSAQGKVREAIALMWEGDELLQRMDKAGPEAFETARSNMIQMYKQVEVAVDGYTCASEAELKEMELENEVVAICEVTMHLTPLNKAESADTDTVELIDDGTGFKLVAL